MLPKKFNIINFEQCGNKGDGRDGGDGCHSVRYAHSDIAFLIATLHDFVCNLVAFIVFMAFGHGQAASAVSCFLLTEE